jgi:hypothetical protein
MADSIERKKILETMARQNRIERTRRTDRLEADGAPPKSPVQRGRGDELMSRDELYLYYKRMNRLELYFAMFPDLR